jgi:predicted transcriptional regulator
MSKATVARALRLLVAKGVLKRVGNLPGRDKPGVYLYLPGGYAPSERA